MTKRPLYTRDEVLQGILDGVDTDEDFSDREDNDGSMAAGSDDEFTDLYEEENDYPPQPELPLDFPYDTCEYVKYLF